MARIDPEILKVQPEDAAALTASGGSVLTAEPEGGAQPGADWGMVRFDLATPATASDEEMGAAARRISKALGVPDSDGKMWNRTRKPYASGREYLDALRGAVRAGDVFEHFKSDELKVWEQADQKRRLELAREQEGWEDKAWRWLMDRRPRSYGYDDVAPELHGAPEDVLEANRRIREDQERRRRYAREQTGQSEPFVEADLGAARERMAAWRQEWSERNVVAWREEQLWNEHLAHVWAGVSRGLSDEARRIGARAMERRQLAPEDVSTFQGLDEQEQRIVAKLARLSRGRVEGGLWNTLTDAGVAFVNGAISTPVNAFRQLGTLKREVEQDLFGDEAGVVPREELNRRAREQQLLYEALGDEPWLDMSGAEHGYFARSVIGAMGTLPYMYYASLGPVGVGAVALDFMQRVDERVVAEGGDYLRGDAQYMAGKVLAGLGYALIEHLSAIPIFKETSDVALRTTLLQVLSRRYRAGAMGKLALYMAGLTATESVEESAQEFIEEITVSLAMGRGPDFENAVRAGAQEFIDTLGTMGLISIFGTARQAVDTYGKRGRAGMLAELENSMMRQEFLQSNAEGIMAAQAQAGDALRQHREAWREGGAAALRERAGVSQELADTLDAVFSAEREYDRVEALVAQRNLSVAEARAQGQEAQQGLQMEIALGGVRQMVEQLGADARGHLQQLGFAEAGAQSIVDFFNTEGQAQGLEEARQRRLQMETALEEGVRQIMQQLGADAQGLLQQLGLTEAGAQQMIDYFDAKREAQGQEAQQRRLQEIALGGVRQMVQRLGADARGHLQQLGFTEAGAQRMVDYFSAEREVQARREQLVDDLRREFEEQWRDGDQAQERGEEALEILERWTPLREAYQRAGTQQQAAKHFGEMGFKPEMAERMAQLFKMEERMAASPAAAAAFKELYLRRHAGESATELLGRMTGFEAKAAPEHGAGAQELTVRVRGEARGRIVYLPNTETEFDPEAPDAPDAVERATGGKVTAQEWLKMTPQQRQEEARLWGFRAMGSFSVVAGDALATGAQADVLTGRIAIGEMTPGTEMFHEATHAWLAVMRSAGMLSEADVAKLQAQYGVSASDPAWFDEEGLADDIREIGAATQWRPEQSLARRFVEQVRRWVNAGARDQVRRTQAQGALQALYENIVYGREFEGIGDFAQQVAPVAEAAQGDAKEAGEERPEVADPLDMVVPVAGAAAVAPDAASVDAAPGPDAAQGNARKAEPQPRVKQQFERPGTWYAGLPRGGRQRLGGYWALVPGSAVIGDTDARYDSSWQPRGDRSSVAGSAQQIAKIASENEFDPHRLLDSPDIATGAMLVSRVKVKNPDTGKLQDAYMIIAGNGRNRVIDAVYDDHRGDVYYQVAQQFADEQGIKYDPSIINEEHRPRLVRVLNKQPVGLTIQQIASESNKNAVLQMTAGEQAAVDAEMIQQHGTAGDYSANVDGLPTRQASNEFMRWFVEASGDESLIDSKGAPTMEARERARRAMLALVVGQGEAGKATVLALIESAGELGLDKVLAALEMSAGNLVALGELKHMYALDQELSLVVSRLLEMAKERRKGKVVDAQSVLAQGDMFQEQNAVFAQLLQLLDSDLKGDEMAAVLRRYVELARKIDVDTEDMFGEAPTPKEGVLELARQQAVGDNAITPADTKYSLVSDAQLLERLEAGETFRAYRAMQLIDGKLYPAMSARVAGEMRQPSELAKWEQADEQPELIRQGKFALDKAQKGASRMPVAYNPYIHASNSPLNDQFASAHKRDNLVVVEVEIPRSEMQSGYRAEGAKDAVGAVPWRAGPVARQLPQDKAREVYLTRYAKPVRIVPNSEVARMVAETLRGTEIAVPRNVVPPALARELEQAGVAISGEDARYSLEADQQVLERIKQIENVREPGHVYESIDALYGAAREVEVEFAEAARLVAESLGFDLKMRRELKKAERVAQKVREDYDGDVSKVVDVLGATLIVDGGEGFHAAIDALRDAGLKIVRIKNGYVNVNEEFDSGYRDIKVNVRMSNGHVGEVILIERSMQERKKEFGHKIYEEQRELDGLAKNASDGQSELIALRDLVQRVSRAYYGVKQVDYAAIAGEINAAIQAVRKAASFSTTSQAASSEKEDTMSSGAPSRRLQGVLTRLPSLMSSLRQTLLPDSSRITSVSRLYKNSDAIVDSFPISTNIKPYNDGEVNGENLGENNAGKRYSLEADAVMPDVVREFDRLTSTLNLPKGTRAERQVVLDKWIADNPEEYAALEKIRADVLEEAGYTEGPVYHGTSEWFNVFRKSKLGSVTGDISGGSFIAHFFADNYDYAEDYARYAAGSSGEPIVRKFFLRQESPYYELSSRLEAMDEQEANAFLRDLIENGNDSLIVSAGEFDEQQTEYAVFDSNQIKSADPLSLDDNGDLITPDRWGDPTKDDIRYSLDITGEAYGGRKENIIIGMMAQAELAGLPTPRRGTIERWADSIGLERMSYRQMRKRAHELAVAAEDAAIIRASQSGDRQQVEFAVGELAREAQRRYVRAGAEQSEKLGRKGVQFERAAEARQRALINATVGADLADLQADTGMDAAASILAQDPRKFDPEAAQRRQEQLEQLLAQGDQLDGAADPDAGVADVETDEDAPRLTDRQRYEIAQRRRTREERLQKLLDAAREQAARERHNRKERRSRAESALQDAAGDGGGAVNAEQNRGATPPVETEPVAIDFTDSTEAAAFWRIWALDRYHRDNPGRAHVDLSKDALAVEFYRKTVIREARELARRLIGPGAAREHIAYLLGEMRQGLSANTIERQSSYIISLINRHAIRESRQSAIKKFRIEMKRQFIKGKKFEELGVDIDRVLTGATEEDARYVARICEMSDEAMDGDISILERERNRLRDIIAQRLGMTDADGNPLEVGDQDMQLRRAQRQFALLEQYGGMIDMMPGEIAELAGRSLGEFALEAERLRERWAEYDRVVKSIREPLLLAFIRAPDAPIAQEGALDKAIDGLIGFMRQRLDYLTRYADPVKREAARDAINDVINMLADGSTTHSIAQQDDHAAILQVLGQIFQTKKGQPSRRRIREYLKRIDSPIPRELAVQLSRQGLHESMTYGQMLQLLVSLDQVASYRTNIRLHNRGGQAALIRSFMFEDPKTGEVKPVFTNEDAQLIEWLRRQFYADKRHVLSTVTMRIAGRRVDSPDPLYMPVKPYREKKSALHQSSGGVWTPLAGVFSRRVAHQLDFDESASLLDMFFSRSRDNALLLAYSERGMMLREIFTDQGIQDAIRRFHGPGALREILQQLEQTLNGGPVRRDGALAAAATAAQKLTTYVGLGWNVQSAMKQTTSFTVWANKIGFKRFFEIVLQPIDRDAVAALRNSDEYRARYGTGPGAGMDIATRTAYENAATTSRAQKFFGDWGLALNRKADWAVSAWLGQAVFRDLKAKYLDQGMSEAAAHRRAVSETWTMIHETQQSGRTENAMSMVREFGMLGRLITQFAHSPLQQAAYEINALREWFDLRRNNGPEANIQEAGQRFLRAAFINHILIPAALTLAVNIYQALTGREPDYTKDDFYWQVLVAILMGQFSRIFIAGAFTEATLKAFFMREMPRGGELIPAEGVIRFGARATLPFRDLVTWDMDNMQKDLRNMARSMAVTRLPLSLYENYIEAAE